MLMLKAVHEARLQTKDAEIARLRDEVTWLRNFIQPNRGLGNVISYEADSVLEGRQEPPSEPLDVERAASIARERELLLSGNY
jgi:hypothetical protein